MLIAARAALRVFPLISPVLEQNAGETRATVVLPVCRAIAVASVAATGPALATEVRYAANHAAAAAAATANSVRATAARAAAATYATTTYAARAAARATASAAEETTAAARVTDRATAAIAARAIAAAARAADAADYSVTASFEAALLEQGAGHESFAVRRLWPEKIPDEIRDAWQDLRDHLLGAGDDWFVWVDWYQDRLDGKPPNRALELAKALIPNEIWEPDRRSPMPKSRG